MDLRHYALLLTALRDPADVRRLAPIPPVTARVWRAGSDPITGTRMGRVPDTVEIAPHDLVSLWHAGHIVGFSLEVTDAGGDEPTRCVIKCDNGEVMERSCTDRSRDIENCWVAVQGECSTGGSASTVVWRGGAGTRTATPRPLPDRTPAW
jgi:hypothetical protein